MRPLNTLILPKNRIKQALEAEDVSAGASQEANKALGAGTPSAAGETDDDLGVPKMPTEDDVQAGAGGDEDMGDPAEPGMDDETSGEDDMGGFGEEGEDQGSSYGNDQQNMEPDTPEDILKKRLLENMIYFHNIIMNNITLLGEANTAPNKVENISLGTVINYLTQCQDILYDEIVKGFSVKSYIEVMKTYVAVQKLYDICIQMAKKIFVTIKKEQKLAKDDLDNLDEGEKAIVS
jgi:hypothetical protein